jgi:hypothetical protein
MDPATVIAYSTAAASAITAVGGAAIALWLKAKQAHGMAYLNAVDGKQESAINDLRKAMNAVCGKENPTCVLRNGAHEIPNAIPMNPHGAA